jgi:ribonuclease HI
VSERIPETLRKTLVLYFDGICDSVNPGGVACYGWVVKTTDGIDVMSGNGVFCKGNGASQDGADWVALGMGLRWLWNHRGGFTDIEIRGDAMTVLQQLYGKWECRQWKLQQLRDRCRELIEDMNLCTANGEWIPPEQNADAAGLASKAYQDETGKPPPERQPRKSTRRWGSSGQTTVVSTNGTTSGTAPTTSAASGHTAA